MVLVHMNYINIMAFYVFFCELICILFKETLISNALIVFVNYIMYVKYSVFFLRCYAQASVVFEISFIMYGNFSLSLSYFLHAFCQIMLRNVSGTSTHCDLWTGFYTFLFAFIYLSTPCFMIYGFFIVLLL